ncbi:Transmembrane protein 120A, partial [Takifugu flavidus]
MLKGLSLHLEEWDRLQGEYEQLQETHRLYLQKLEEISQLQDKCSSSISIQHERLKEVHQMVKRLAYKDEYEKFKLYLTVLLLLLSVVCYFFVTYRVLDAILNFLLLWFYCTLTVRESILISNGSRIKGWWVFHHYISAFLSGVMLTWPDGSQYRTFRNQFLAYSFYQSFVQCLQCYYQSGCLYRLRSLGERHNLDLTV